MLMLTSLSFVVSFRYLAIQIEFLIEMEAIRQRQHLARKLNLSADSSDSSSPPSCAKYVELVKLANDCVAFACGDLEKLLGCVF